MPDLPYPDRDGRAPVERVVLLGFMCSGKSTVAQALARRLGWTQLDFDVEIERRDGRSVAAIIETEGEAAFRAREAALTREAAEVRGLVLAPGGGWIMQPELLGMLGVTTFAVWLRTSPEETVRRLFTDDIARPLRDHPDPVGAVAEFLAEREPLYRLADLTVPTDGRAVEEIAFEIEQVVRLRSAPLYPERVNG